MQLSIIIPAYNEEARIGATMQEVIGYLQGQAYESELIVVDDGSDDGTRAVVTPFVGGAHPEVRLFSLDRNRGKGAAVRAGMFDYARGAYRLFYDADASTPVSEIDRLWACFDAGADVVIGSRARADSDVQVHQAWYRERMGRIFNVFVRLLRLTRFKDTQCGFKAFTAAACAAIFPRQTITHFSFDAELLHIAQRHGLRIVELGVRWSDRLQSRVHPINDSIRMFRDLLWIRLQAFLGRYA